MIINFYQKSDKPVLTEDHMLTKDEGTEVIYEFIASEEQVKYSCTQIFRMAFDLYNHNVTYAEDRRHKLTDYLAA